MDITVLNTDRIRTDIIDSYKSFIWTDRYNECGDFEIYTPVTVEAVLALQQDRYLQVSKSNRAMIIENLKITTDIEEGNWLIATGRSLESILSRRIIWGQKTVSGNFQNGIKTLINESIINPTLTDRKIDNFIFKDSVDPEITSIELDYQLNGDNLYEAISTLCKVLDIGFKITFDDNYNFVFELYKGKDRSYAQTENSYVVFSPEFDNILNSEYYNSLENVATCAYITGEANNDTPPVTTSIVNNDLTGIFRREIYVDASGTSSTDEDGNTIPNDTYILLLQDEGNKALSEHKRISNFNGEADTQEMFVYGRDFFLGDYIQLENEYGFVGMSRVSEITFSQDDNTISVYPTFVALE